MARSKTDQKKTNPQSKKSSRLDRLETIQQTKRIYNSIREESYESDPIEFDRVQQVFDHLYRYRSPETMRRFEDCGRTTHLYYDPVERTIRSTGSFCHIRWCPVCSPRRVAQISGACFDWLLAAREPSFITLTLHHIAGEALSVQLDRLHEAFKKFRRHKRIKELIFGGIWFLQVKRGGDAQWHSHLHIAADSTFIPKNELSGIWSQASNGSKIIDISRVRSKRAVAGYVSRYVSRVEKLSNFSFDDALEVCCTLRGRRLYGKWGNASQLRFKTATEQLDTSGLVKIGTLKQLASAARLNCYPEVNAVYDAYRTHEPIDHNSVLAAIDIISAMQFADNSS